MLLPVSAVFSAVSAASRLAYTIYEKGLRSNVPYDQDYAQLANAVQDFASVLKSIDEVHQNAVSEVERYRASGSISIEQNLASFKTMTGDFKATLDDCQNLLDRKESYARGHGGMPARLAWNLTAAEEVRELKDRIIFHHVRLCQVLQPVKISLTLKISEAIRDLHDDVRLIMGALGLNPTGPVPSTAAVPPHLPDVPEYLQGIFDHQADADKDLPVSDEIRISSIMGHLSDSSPAASDESNPSPRAQAVLRYVNLMKAIWILRSSNDATSSITNLDSSLTSVIWRNLQLSVAQSLSNYGTSSGKTPPPNTQEIRAIPQSKFVLWIFQPGSRPLQPKTMGLSEFLMLEVPLEPPQITRHKYQLVVTGSAERSTSLQVTTSLVDSVGRSLDKETYPINTTNAVLIPTYAQPGAQLFNVQLRASSDFQRYMTLQFKKSSDLLKLQRCLTGFEVKHDQPRLRGVKFKESGFRAIKRMEILSEAVDMSRAQIWYHRPVHDEINSIGSSSVSSSSALETPTSPISAPTTSLSPPPRRKSQASSSARSQTQSLDDLARRVAPSSRTPRRITENVSTQEIPNLEEPKVVIFLAIRNMSTPMTTPISTTTTTSFTIKSSKYFSFPLRQGITIDLTSCKCHTDTTCPILVLKSRGGGPLNAKLHDYSNDLNNWNLLALGQAGHQAANQNCKNYDDLSRIVLTFETARDRKAFGEILEDARDLYEVKRRERELSIRDIQRIQIVR